jgi:hypothetical protein
MQRQYKGDDLNEIASIVFQLERQRDAIDRALGALREVDGTGTAASAKRQDDLQARSA